MSTETKERVDTGGLAFPIGDNSAGPAQPGMTLRDYVAAKAMQALIESSYREGGFSPDPPDTDFEPCDYVNGEALWYRDRPGGWYAAKYDAHHSGRTPYRRIHVTTANELLARHAYTIADAMIAEKRRTEQH